MNADAWIVSSIWLKAKVAAPAEQWETEWNTVTSKGCRAAAVCGLWFVSMYSRGILVIDGRGAASGSYALMNSSWHASELGSPQDIWGASAPSTPQRAVQRLKWT